MSSLSVHKNMARHLICSRYGCLILCQSKPETLNSCKKDFSISERHSQSGMKFENQGSTKCSGYSYADWAKDLVDRVSTSDCISFWEMEQFVGEATSRHE